MTPSTSGATPRAGATDASGFLAGLRHELRPAFLTLRALVVSLGPEVNETVGGGEVTYCRRDKVFLKVRGAKSHLALVFPEGVDIPDPHGRLLKRGDERYAPLDSAESLDGHVQEFVRRSYAALR